MFFENTTHFRCWGICISFLPSCTPLLFQQQATALDNSFLHTWFLSIWSAPNSLGGQSALLTNKTSEEAVLNSLDSRRLSRCVIWAEYRLAVLCLICRLVQTASETTKIWSGCWPKAHLRPVSEWLSVIIYIMQTSMYAKEPDRSARNHAMYAWLHVDLQQG